MQCTDREGCTEEVLAKGLCSKHYKRAWVAARPPKPECSVPDCKKESKARDYCDEHYYHWRRYGDPLGRAIRVKENPCTVATCKRMATSRWIVNGELKGYLCGHCYERWKKYGNPLEPPRRAANGEARYLRDDGYIDVSVPGPNGKLRTRREHIVFMEELLGRPLAGDENVHHCNGVKHDNTINGPLVNYRSGNLELWSTKQPKGQRVPDKIAFALEILREYQPEALLPAERLVSVK